MYSTVPHPLDEVAFEISALHFRSTEVFCQKEEGIEIALDTLPVPNGSTIIHLRAYPSGKFSPCRIDHNFDRFRNHNFGDNIPVPDLQMPSETIVLQKRRGGDKYFFSSSVYLQTRLSAEALADHYFQQLRQAGWTQRTATRSEDLIASVWQIETDTSSVWQGFLRLIAQPESGQWTGIFSASADDNASE